MVAGSKEDTMTTNVSTFFADLDAGVFEEKLSRVLSEVAGAVIDHDRQGEVTIKLTLKRIGNSHQVSIKHKLTYKRPTSKGSVVEDNTTETPMHVGTRGRLSLFPEDQTDMFGKNPTKEEHIDG